MKYGLTSKQLKLILDCFKQFPELEKVILFGSRAMENHKTGSDIDILPVGKNLSSQTVARLSGCLNEEISVPFQFDVVAPPISSELKQHIDKHGIIIFERAHSSTVGNYKTQLLL